MGRFSNGMRRFFAGRYGTDQLNRLLMWVGIIINIVSIFVAPPAKLILILIAYLLLGWAIFRMFSRNTWKRFDENRKYVAFLTRLRDRDHRYYKCPKCRQKIRVPKGKGKIAITCPKCREKFIRKT